jgi:magnesium chelatase family protein
LFLDELPEFQRNALEALRQPLEDGIAVISRVRAHASFPARPLVVGAMNPCACGYLGDGSGRCKCSPERTRHYRSRLSGPLLDRIDIHVVLAPVRVAALQKLGGGEPTSAVRERVARARAIQRERFERGAVSAPTNAALAPADFPRVASLSAGGARLLASAIERIPLSARAYTKVLRVARTIADLEGETDILPPHIAEAVGLRVLDRGAPAAATAA